MRIIAWHDDGWFDSEVTDYRMWDHLCRAYGVELQHVRDWSEVSVGSDEQVYLFEENPSSVELADHTVNIDGVYVFGRTGLDLLAAVPDHDEVIQINTPNPISLFGVVCAGIFLREKLG